MNKITILIVLTTWMTFMSGCLVMNEPYAVLAPGVYRAVLKLDGKPNRPLNTDAKPPNEEIKFEEVTDGELPFTFELVYDTKDKFHIEIINGEERIRVDDIVYGHNRVNGDDTIRIEFPHYDSYIRALYEEDVIEGEWVVKTKKNYTIPFVAWQGKNHRFTTLKKEPVNVAGKWEVTFGEKGEEYSAIGEFQQEGNYLTGTFLTETGDYRFLEGTVQADKMYLSTFDGSHAFLFEAKMLPDSTLVGTFRSGSHYKDIWIAKRNSSVTLTDPNTLTYLKEGYDKVTFSFENSDGKRVSLEDEKYKDKIKIVQIIGTWCPNCADETQFLADYLSKNKNKDLAVIALAYEKHKHKEKAFSAISKFKKRFGIDYEVLWAGSSKKDEAAKTLPMLNHILSYPTMIFLDKNDKVRKIHTGFAGPATSEYPKFIKEFNDFVGALLNE